MSERRARQIRRDEPGQTRRWAVDQITRKGAGVEAVAAALGYGRSPVFSWVQRFQAGGLRALDTRPRSGRPPKLTPRQRARLLRYIVGDDPRQLHFEFALWTREMVVELIACTFDVVMSVTAVGRMLRRMGLSPQRPLWRADQADAATVAEWKATAFPRIQAGAR